MRRRNAKRGTGAGIGVLSELCDQIVDGARQRAAEGPIDEHRPGRCSHPDFSSGLLKSNALEVPPIKHNKGARA